ncbi:hypothetical protein B0H13DRAFT_1623441 [Mycena leptocephala]|nr:hypothetical protein B0H13DRAFT_1623441 [Mycena leptocephala]
MAIRWRRKPDLEVFVWSWNKFRGLCLGDFDTFAAAATKLCRLCSNAIESMHHIFVDCRKFEGWRTEAGVEVTTRTERKLLEMGIAILNQQPILHAAKYLFIDDPIIWPLKMSQYYLGQVPRTDDLITLALIPETIKRRKLSVHLASDWHTSSIRLAGRIFGSVQRTMAARAAGTTS